MARLIDADALIEEAKKLHVDDYMLVMAMVSKQPTAYDVKNVCLQMLEKNIRGLTIDKAIEIVKGGGVE